MNYDRDLDSLATVSVDRAGVPIGGQVHVTISDFRLNLDPTENDVWFMVIDGEHAEYEIDDADCYLMLIPSVPPSLPVTGSKFSKAAMPESLPLAT